jgi:2-succinyl-6-hydroxy-2,4-cyclohexadiene-1-carboxylate synthase
MTSAAFVLDRDEPRPRGTKAGPVVLLHGFLGEPSDWDAVVADLELPREVFRADLLSAATAGGSVDALAKAVAGAIRAQGLAPASVVGYSLGARVLFALLDRHGDAVGQALVISGTPGLEEEDERRARREADDRLAEALRSQGLAEFLDHWYAQPLFASLRTHPDFGLIARRRLAGDAEAWSRILAEASPGRTRPVWERLPAFAGRLRLAVGALDGKYLDLARQVQEREPRIPIAVVEGAGHAIHLERPEAVASLVDRLP